MIPPSDLELTQQVRDLALGQLDVDLLGVAPVDRLDGAPEGSRPTDYLPTARAVIVLALKIPDGAIKVAGRYDEEGKTLSPYMWYGYIVPNWDLSEAAARLTKYLDKKGYAAIPFPPTGLLYKFGDRADLSHRHAAVAAGLGEFGLNGLLLTPDFGPRQRVVSIVTDAPLVPSPMYNGPALCRPDVCGRPRPAPPELSRGGNIRSSGEKTFEYASVDHVRCKWQYPGKGFRRTKVPIPPNAPGDFPGSHACDHHSTCSETNTGSSPLQRLHSAVHLPRFVEGSGRRSSKVKKPTEWAASVPVARRWPRRAQRPLVHAASITVSMSARSSHLAVVATGAHIEHVPTTFADVSMRFPSVAAPPPPGFPRAGARVGRSLPGRPRSRSSPWRGPCRSRNRRRSPLRQVHDQLEARVMAALSE